MNRIEETFRRLSFRGEKALVGFVTAGDPDPERSLALCSALCAGGVDVLELGVPFSDPTADGPVIQRSSARALAAGTDLAAVLAIARGLRARYPVPIVLFSYYNPILAYGAAAFHRDALAAGADGLLVVDLPPEESAELTAGWPDGRLALIRLTTPTTPPARMAAIAASASGFIYHVSRLGVTGGAAPELAGIERQLGRLRRFTSLPVCVGFGIARPEEASAVGGVADGVVVGSAFEKTIEAHADDPRLPERLGRQARALKEALPRR
ncbi:MAG: tryptophan synthase subunit alpha [Desulfobacterales bacterium]